MSPLELQKIMPEKCQINHYDFLSNSCHFLILFLYFNTGNLNFKNFFYMYKLQQGCQMSLNSLCQNSETIMPFLGVRLIVENFNEKVQI